MAYNTATGEEFIVVGTSNGVVYKIESKDGRFENQGVGFTIGVVIPIVCMASCPKTKTLAVATGSGACVFLQPKDKEEWAPIGSSLDEISKESSFAALSVEVLNRGQY